MIKVVFDASLTMAQKRQLFILTSLSLIAFLKLIPSNWKTLSFATYANINLQLSNALKTTGHSAAKIKLPNQKWEFCAASATNFTTTNQQRALKMAGKDVGSAKKFIRKKKKITNAY